ncbi:MULTISPECIES: SDR family NAD(P)-dependent oxidoreductase [Sphingobium]|uniref:SDR family NAD(P)-dependent oxidoreductase n=1 Tax=Sphingobium tyrosinilyticum TaxID=2715436 RepID=A0ABV9F100_9SPHN|nr:SDR family NAD(P)-dependent oxidoreductase [Sphingobium sp. EP60837]ANI79343.1 Dehydrogenase/reductase SDR family member [Sphingobium sp. EP60837]
MSGRKVAVVTGASRGAGKGIAVALGAAGATVYLTGRSVKEEGLPLPGTIGATARAVDEAGGRGIGVAVDHRDDAAVEALMARIAEEAGHIDLLVHSATALSDDLVRPGPFWDKSADLADIFDVGLRSAYVATRAAAPLLLKAEGALVVAISSPGAHCYMHGPGYGAQKAGLDKMMFDMAHDFRPFGVATLSLWPGPMRTERLEKGRAERPEIYGAIYDAAETPELQGRVIDAVARDAERMALSGRAFYTADLAERYGIVDLDGRRPPSFAAMLGEPHPFHPAVIE